MVSLRGQLLVAAAILSCGTGAAKTGPVFNRLGRRMPLSNNTVSAEVASTPSIEPSSSFTPTSSPTSSTPLYPVASPESMTSTVSSSTYSPALTPNSTTSEQSTSSSVPLVTVSEVPGGNYTTITIRTYPVASSPSASITPDPETTEEVPPPECTSANATVTTQYSIIYTSTITLTGDPAEYTPPFPPISLPIECQTLPSGSSKNAPDTTYKKTGAPNYATSLATTQPAASHGPVTTSVFYTTDKNPVIVYSTSSQPGYGGNPSSENEHREASTDAVVTIPDYGMVTSTPEAQQSTYTSGGSAGKSTAVTVVVQPSQVVINGQTFTDNAQSKTATVVVGTDTFVINPTNVLGAGATIVRPSSSGGIFVAVPTTTTLGGLQVVYDSSAVTIDGSVFTVGPTPSTAVVRGQTISIGTDGLGFPTQTVPITFASSATKVAVVGGELITAIGQSVVVIQRTTITYGQDSGTITKVVDGETILLSAAGVSVHGSTIGGVTASPSATTYAIIGGATITQQGSTAVVVGGTTYKIGSGASTTLTTVIGTQTLTIGPNGVSTSTYTYAQPYASTTTIIGAEGTAKVASPTESAKNAGLTLRPDWGSRFMICIAIGVGISGHLLW